MRSGVGKGAAVRLEGRTADPCGAASTRGDSGRAAKRLVVTSRSFSKPGAARCSVPVLLFRKMDINFKSSRLLLFSGRMLLAVALQPLSSESQKVTV
jgi:hypothetical protein